MVGIGRKKSGKQGPEIALDGENERCPRGGEGGGNIGISPGHARENYTFCQLWEIFRPAVSSGMTDELEISCECMGGAEGSYGQAGIENSRQILRCIGFGFLCGWGFPPLCQFLLKAFCILIAIHPPVVGDESLERGGGERVAGRQHPAH